MLDRLISFLRQLPEPERAGPSADDPRVAAAALLFHVMDADGERHGAEIDRLREVMRDSYELGDAELRTLVSAGEEADRDAVDLYAFTSVLGRHLDTQGRHELIRIMWEVVYADGRLHELEDNIVWRVAELVGVDARDRVELRREVAGRIVADDDDEDGEDGE